jgi:cyclopropane fatty-acyl-phospholipid synthase-like methyltransferase
VENPVCKPGYYPHSIGHRQSNKAEAQNVSHFMAASFFPGGVPNTPPDIQKYMETCQESLHTCPLLSFLNQSHAGVASHGTAMMTHIFLTQTSPGPALKGIIPYRINLPNLP